MNEVVGVVAAPKPAYRMFALDVLRGMAILMVIVHHTGIEEDFGTDGGVIFHKIAATSWAGVDLFFVLSGFLISGLLFKELQQTGNLQLRRFWLRRGLKIWPSYFVTYGALVLLRVLADARVHAWDDLSWRLESALPNLVMIQNYFPRAWMWPNSWSLAVEEHFYLALPLILVTLTARARSRGDAQPYKFNGFFVGGAVVCLIVLLFRIADAGTAEPNAYYPTHMRADELCFGVMLGYLFHYKRPLVDRIARFWPLLVTLAPLALLAVLPLGCPWPGYPPAPGQPPHSGHYLSTFTVGMTMLAIGFGALVLCAGVYPEAGLRAPLYVRAPMKALAFIGGYSYTIYLSHAFVLKAPGFHTAIRIARHVYDDNWTDRFMLFALSIPLGILISHVVERPALKWRERHLPAPSKAKRSESPAPAPSA